MSVLYPVFAMFVLTISVAMRLAALRYSAVSQGKVSGKFYEAYVGDEPLYLRVTARHLTNLLEVPVLFYIGCLLAFVTHQSGVLVIGLAWAYVLLRVIHTLIHLGSNIVIWRFRVFALSVFALVALWVTLFVGLATR